jgi:DME family drug/metabolite transporter
LGEKLTLKIYLALGLGLAGTSLLAIDPQATPRQDWQFLGGVVLALGAGLAYAAYAVGAKVAIQHLPPFQVLALSFTAAGAMLSPVLLFNSQGWGNWQIQVPFLLYLGLAATGFAYLIYMQGLKSTPATTAGIAVLLEPLTATCLGVIVFREPLGLRGAIGGLLLLGTIALLIPRKAS